MGQRKRNAEVWSANEEALRNKHGELSLMVRHQVYARPDGQEVTAGGWAFLDGEPAIVPTNLDLIVVSVLGDDGSMETMGRDPAAVVALLGDRVTLESAPVEHWAIRVGEADKAGLLEQIRGLPEHTPDPATSSPGGSLPGGAFGQAAFAPTLEAPAPAPAPALAPGAAAPAFVPTAQATPTRSSSAVGAGMGIAAALIGGGCLVVALLALVGAGAAFWIFQAEQPHAYEPYEPPEAYEPPVPSPAIPTPGPRAAAGDRYAVPLPASAPSRGAVTAPLTIQIFSDFQCPFCGRVNPTIAEIEQNYEGRVRFVWRHFPLSFHANAMPAAEASMEVFTQGGDVAFWAYHDLLFENQRQLDTNNLVALAGRVPGVNSAGVSAALADHRHRARVQSDMDAVARAGMRIGTPSFLIGDLLLSGAQPYPRFASVIDAELAGR